MLYPSPCVRPCALFSMQGGGVSVWRASRRVNVPLAIIHFSHLPLVTMMKSNRMPRKADGKGTRGQFYLLSFNSLKNRKVSQVSAKCTRRLVVIPAGRLCLKIKGSPPFPPHQ
ncbi:hypothetical protein GDO81_027920 [Engystomops pustulosus]|uniref:Uncharacterized protein n=1 Tax=Engystomops pustulosus TaxID=76066 RepID=A0AAV6ZDP6_ENGPU|nr:hypothetical protein GDO81_027920 [Engystomops pustulosus]